MTSYTRGLFSGISAVVDPVGRVVTETGLLTRENLRYDIAMMDSDTIYTKLGDWPGWLALIALAWIFIVRRDEAQ